MCAIDPLPDDGGQKTNFILKALKSLAKCQNREAKQSIQVIYWALLIFLVCIYVWFSKTGWVSGQSLPLDIYGLLAIPFTVCLTLGFLRRSATVQQTATTDGGTQSVPPIQTPEQSLSQRRQNPSLIIFSIVLLWLPILIIGDRQYSSGDVDSALQLTRNDAARAGLLAKTSDTNFRWLIEESNQDPAVAIAGLELEFGKHLKKLAVSKGIKSELPVDDLLLMLLENRHIAPTEYTCIHELMADCRLARDTHISNSTAKFAISEIGIPLLNFIDSKMPGL